MRPRSRSSSSSFFPSRKSRTSRTCSPYSSRDTGSTQGAGQRLIWYCRQGRRRLCSTWSVQVRSWKCRLTTRKRSEEHTSELQSRFDLVCRLLLEKKKYKMLLHDVAA